MSLVCPVLKVRSRPSPPGSRQKRSLRIRRRVSGYSVLIIFEEGAPGRSMVVDSEIQASVLLQLLADHLRCCCDGRSRQHCYCNHTPLYCKNPLQYSFSYSLSKQQGSCRKGTCVSQVHIKKRQEIEIPTDPFCRRN